MPLPRPRDGESQDEFMGRCMSNKMMKSEFPKNKQRVAVCMQSFRDKGKKRESSVKMTDSEAEKIILAFINKYPKLKKYLEEADDDR